MTRREKEGGGTKRSRPANSMAEEKRIKVGRPHM